MCAEFHQTSPLHFPDHPEGQQMVVADREEIDAIAPAQGVASLRHLVRRRQDEARCDGPIRQMLLRSRARFDRYAPRKVDL